MTEKFVIATGMFRSGTTLLARMLNAHPNLAFASDPFFQIFRTFRNEVAKNVIDGWDMDLPLDDYYFHPDKQKVMSAIQNADMDMSLKDINVDDLRNKVAEASRPYSPRYPVSPVYLM